MIWNALVSYLLLSVAGSIIPVNCSFRQPDNGVEIFISSNGVHTDFVVPVQHEIFNWRSFIPGNHLEPYWSYATHIAFGWGDRGFYLKTPEWKDLKPGTAIRATLIPTPSAVHVTLWSQPVEDHLTKKILIDTAQYLKLIDFITATFKTDKKGIPVFTAPGYGNHDVFYDGVPPFHLFRTCNTWTNDGLNYIGVRCCFWTFYDRAILWQLNQIPD